MASQRRLTEAEVSAAGELGLSFVSETWTRFFHFPRSSKSQDPGVPVPSAFWVPTEPRGLAHRRRRGVAPPACLGALSVRSENGSQRSEPAADSV